MKQVFYFLLFYFLLPIQSKAQSSPKLVPQVTFDLGLDEVQVDADNKYFLATSDNNYTLIEQSSKIQLGTLAFDAGGWAAQGIGKTVPSANGSVFISTGYVLMKANLLTGIVDTFFNSIKYPEMIENITLWPGAGKVLIHTKTYPLKKDSTITCYSDNREESEYLGPENCKLYLVDAVTGKVLGLAPTEHLFTAFAPQLYNGEVLGGTYNGDVVSIKEELAQTILFKAFDTVVHQLVAVNSDVVAVPAQARKYVGGDYGDGRICIYKNGKREREFVFDTEQPEDKFSMVGASSSVFRVFYNQKNNSVFISYGFSRLVEVNLQSLDTVHYPVSFKMAKFYCWNNDSTQLLASADNIQDVFATSRKQELYDITTKKFQPAFRTIDEQEKFTKYYKVFDSEGNYHIVAYKQDYSSDTLIIFSSNKTLPVTLACKWCKFNFDDKKNTVSILKYGQAKIYRLLLDKLQQSNYSVDDNVNAAFLVPVFSSDNVVEGKIPKEISEAKCINNNYLIAGSSALIITDSLGKIVFMREGLARLFSGELFKISPTGKFVAIVNAGEKRHSMEVWDWAANKKMFNYDFNKGTDIQHFTFDKANDVLWYSTHRWTTGTMRELVNEVYKVEVAGQSAEPELVVTDPRFFSFEVDMQADRVAFEAYDKLYIAKLSTLDVIWNKVPRATFFDVHHTANGFLFSNEREAHSFNSNGSYMYFTSYSGQKMVEVANEYLYRGEKSAINNLSFVYQGKGYLPADYDIYFNRPDTVLRMSGATNAEFISLLEGAVGKRLRKIKAKSLEEILQRTPEIEIVNRANLPLVVLSDEVVLETKITSKYTAIKSFHVIANGVPVYGNAGKAITIPDVSVSCKIKLQAGNNVLQVFVMDANGVKSATATVTLVAEYKAPEPKTYFIGIGIDEFKEKGHNLKYSVKDIRNLAEGLRAKFGDNVVIDTLFNEKVSVENVMALQNRLQQANVNDRVIVSYSGHGLLDKQLDYFLSTYAINFRNPVEGGLSYNLFEQLLDSLPMRQKLLLIDACHSGEVDKEALDNMRVVFADTSKHIYNGGKNGIELLVDDEQVVGLKNSFELMQEMFSDVGRGTGATVISAAAGTQVAYEKGELQNGVFTYCVLQLLTEKPTCTVQELKTYVSMEVERLTNGLQKPTGRTETAGFDWKVW